DGFDFPVGIPNGTGYYNAQNFTENNHLGEDWNGIGGGNTDMADPIYSIANGYVSFSENIGGGWGNVIRITHYIDSNRQIESLYAHCNEISVKVGDIVNRGIPIGTIGTNNGMYWAHLHFEIRDIMNLPIGGGYSNITEGYLDPTKFINNNRN
ncbi:MAG: M23 family metallopeptidase, partial [Crocinitomicaceae bacterium]|nr:M23 family metallopeptidase [Crocinitomicaceae bacterium]